jgi:hypothetical protein
MSTDLQFTSNDSDPANDSDDLPPSKPGSETMEVSYSSAVGRNLSPDHNGNAGKTSDGGYAGEALVAAASKFPNFSFGNFPSAAALNLTKNEDSDYLVKKDSLAHHLQGKDGPPFFNFLIFLSPSCCLPYATKVT